MADDDQGYFSGLKALLGKMKQKGQESNDDFQTSLGSARKMVQNPDYTATPEEQAANLRYTQGVTNAVAGAVNPIKGFQGLAPIEAGGSIMAKPALTKELSNAVYDAAQTANSGVGMPAAQIAQQTDSKAIDMMQRYARQLAEKKARSGQGIR